jgi:hypothetical protein
MGEQNEWPFLALSQAAKAQAKFTNRREKLICQSRAHFQIRINYVMGVMVGAQSPQAPPV